MRRSGTQFLTVVVLGLVLVILFGAAIGMVLMQRTEPFDVRNIDNDPTKAAVRTFLREHTHSGKWEEVRWWPEVSVHAGKRTQQYVKVRIRTHNGFGALTVDDFLFEVRSRKANHISSLPEILDESKLFPDT